LTYSRYRQRQLYELIADVDSYHRFVPYCTASRVLKKTRQAVDAEMTAVSLEAELKVGFLGFEEKYISKVECRPYEMVQVHKLFASRQNAQ
jgi:coenzyme Q-binding protein COQ10